MLSRSVHSTYLSDIDSDHLYTSHLGKLDRIYTRKSIIKEVSDREQFAYGVAKCKLVHNDFKYKETALNRKMQNIRIFKTISDIQKRTKSVTSVNNAALINNKSLRDGLMNRNFADIDRENLRIQNKICNVKSDYNRSQIMKSSSQLLSHRNHLKKFKTKDRLNIKLPPIMQKETKITLKGLHIRDLSPISVMEPSRYFGNNSVREDDNDLRDIVKTSIYDDGDMLVVVGGPDSYCDDNEGKIR